jgi:hypothetical protein
MSQEPTDISLDALLRTLELHYAYRAAGLFRANGIPEPPRLPDPTRPEPPAGIDVPPQPSDPAISE